MSLEKLPDILRALADEHVDYILIGAVAMMAHGLVRGTEDLDFFVRPDSEKTLLVCARHCAAFSRRTRPSMRSPKKIWPETIQQSGTTRPMAPLGLIFCRVWERHSLTRTSIIRRHFLRAFPFEWRRRPCYTA